MKILRVKKVNFVSKVWAKKSIALDIVKASIVVFSADNAIGID